MRKYIFILVGVLIVAAAILIVVSRPGWLDTLGFGSAAPIRRMTVSFLEDVQFKDFSRAASYHTPEERKTIDIPYLLERLFFIKPEQLDIMEYEVLFAKIDSTGLRGRTKTRIKVKNLLNGTIEDRELMLYFYRDSRSSPWYMRLESSLRQLEGEEGKKH